MYNYFKSKKISSLLIKEAPAFIIALTVAEIFFKFGIFSLEVVCFLITWFCLSFIFELIGKNLKNAILKRSEKQ